MQMLSSAIAVVLAYAVGSLSFAVIVSRAMGLADPKDVAKDGYEALMNGETRVISGITNKIQAMLSNLAPDSLIAAGMRKVFESPSK